MTRCSACVVNLFESSQLACGRSFDVPWPAVSVGSVATTTNDASRRERRASTEGIESPIDRTRVGTQLLLRGTGLRYGAVRSGARSARWAGPRRVVTVPNG